MVCSTPLLFFLSYKTYFARAAATTINHEKAFQTKAHLYVPVAERKAAAMYEPSEPDANKIMRLKLDLKPSLLFPNSGKTAVVRLKTAAYATESFSHKKERTMKHSSSERETCMYGGQYGKSMSEGELSRREKWANSLQRENKNSHNKMKLMTWCTLVVV